MEREMKKLLAFILVLGLAFPALAQQTVTLTYPTNTNQWATLDSAGTVTADFVFSSRWQRHGYSGFCTVYMLIDSAVTATQTVASYDSVTVNAYALIRDPIDSQYEIGTTNQFVAGKDSIQVFAPATNWSTNHSDDTYAASKIMNIQNCDGIRIVATSQSDCIIRFFLKYSYWD
jgi:hypothetical protein